PAIGLNHIHTRMIAILDNSTCPTTRHARKLRCVSTLPGMRSIIGSNHRSENRAEAKKKTVRRHFGHCQWQPKTYFQSRTAGFVCRKLAKSASHDKRRIPQHAHPGAQSTTGDGLESGADQPGNRGGCRAFRTGLDAVGRTAGPLPRSGCLAPVSTRKPGLELATKAFLARNYLQL